MTSKSKPSLLLHICCAPCAVYLLDHLKESYDVTGFFYNPNIEPPREYQSRLQEMQNLARKINARVLYGEYDNEAWRTHTAPLADEPEGGARCRICFAHRLSRTAALAALEGFDFFATTLSVSPRKNVHMINEEGRRAAADADVSFLEADFKKKNGFLKSVRRCKEHGLYRQSYCGCLFSR